MVGDRHSYVPIATVITDPEVLARKEAANGVEQFYLALEMIKAHVNDPERPFKLRPSQILQLHHEALKDIHPLAGTFRNTAIGISGSTHSPPEPFMVSEEIAALCDYVNRHWEDMGAIHLAAYVLWRTNWIHPFSDGNGRTARAIAYVVLSIKLKSILPGSPTIPDQISVDKRPYYDALEQADKASSLENPNVSALEEMMGRMLATQLLAATEEASANH